MTLTDACTTVRAHLGDVAVPVIDGMTKQVNEMAPKTAACGAVHALGCGFLAGAQYALTVMETGKALDEDAMRNFLLDAWELTLDTTE